MGIVVQRNIGALGDLLRLTDQASATAAGAGDATSVTGQTIDRANIAGGVLPLSALMAVLFSATLASGKTLSVAYAVQDSADGTNFSDYQTGAATVAATGPSGGGTVRGQYEIPVNLTSARRYVRLNFQPDLSATGTDTAVAIGAGFFAGFDRLAAPQG
ncbi:MAG TPA: hypothetical protein VFB54_17700 [Burkholderiales bacterium]|nr:hypothetical protein [Burkholderiales bacterium]